MNKNYSYSSSYAFYSDDITVFRYSSFIFFHNFTSQVQSGRFKGLKVDGLKAITPSTFIPKDQFDSSGQPIFQFRVVHLKTSTVRYYKGPLFQWFGPSTLTRDPHFRLDPDLKRTVQANVNGRNLLPSVCHYWLSCKKIH